jgi:hypothetical protein
MKTMKILAAFLMPVLLISCGFFVAPRNEIQEVTLIPRRDGYINDIVPPPATFTDFLSNTMWISQGNHYYSLIEFNLDKIPFGAQILSAKLSLNCISANADDHIWINRIKESWDESDIRFDINQTYDNIELIIPNPLPPLPYLVTVEIRSITQSWANGAANYGIILSPGATADIEFETTESGTFPELFIRYY